MNADLSHILVFGPLVVAFAVSALVLLVRFDLAPVGSFAGAFEGPGRWFLGAALGFGIVGFSIKLAIITILASFPRQTIAPLLADPVEMRARAAARLAAPP
ncbi:MAG: hypothetical protein HQL40_21480, partial [Alphaproteobacteria bacterium]|nr:hypothetical protein [Alphaproteobacteria bacterium]